VQSDRDLLIISNARSKPLDPSLPPTDGIPTTAKMGIDATIPENVPRERYQRIVYFNEGKVRLEDYMGQTTGPSKARKEAVGDDNLEALAGKVLKVLSRSHRFFAELLELFPGEDYGKIARAIGLLNRKDKITQDGEGKYQLRGEGLRQTR
ncbi:MAG: UbiD family decarboxylase, partial [Candidatus Binatia bacterium]